MEEPLPKKHQELTRDTISCNSTDCDTVLSTIFELQAEEPIFVTMLPKIDKKEESKKYKQVYKRTDYIFKQISCQQFMISKKKLYKLISKRG